jgi:hypothetical protein
LRRWADIPEWAEANICNVFDLELLPNYVGIAGVPAKPLRHPLLKPGQRSWPAPTAIRRPPALCQPDVDGFSEIYVRAREAQMGISALLGHRYPGSWT